MLLPFDDYFSNIILLKKASIGASLAWDPINLAPSPAYAIDVSSLLHLAPNNGPSNLRTP